jgi:hypothetical protein
MNKLLAVLVAGLFAAGAFAAEPSPAPASVPAASVPAVKAAPKLKKHKVHHVVHKAAPKTM